MEKLPKIDLKALKKEMELNRKQRMEFVKMHAEWIKRTPDKEWSRQQKELIG